MTVTGAVLAMIVGGILSLASDLLPKFKDWFGELENYQKRWVTILLNLIVAIALVLLSCWEATAVLIGKYVVITCTEAGIIQVVEVFVFSIMGSQATFLLAPVNGKGKPKA